MPGRPSELLLLREAKSSPKSETIWSVPAASTLSQPWPPPCHERPIWKKKHIFRSLSTHVLSGSRSRGGQLAGEPRPLKTVVAAPHLPSQASCISSSTPLENFAALFRYRTTGGSFSRWPRPLGRWGSCPPWPLFPRISTTHTSCPPAIKRLVGLKNRLKKRFEIFSA